jgi:hypothetical protein
MQFANYGKLDDKVVVDGDASFTGVDMRDQSFSTGRDRSFLAPGMLARSENKRLRYGSIDRRMGTSYPPDFNPVFTNQLAGSTIYRNPNGQEVMLVAQLNSNFVWQLQFGKDAVQIPIAAGGTTGSGFLSFTQAFDKVVMCRPGQSPLQWDGIAAGGFAAFAAAGSGRTGIINAWAGTPFGNRIIYYYPLHPNVPYRDELLVSDVLTYNQYLDPDYKFRINAGESSSMTCVFPYFKGAAVCFMSQSIHLLEKFTGSNPITESSQRLLSDRLNGVGRYLPLLNGADVIFLSRPSGFYRLSQIIQDEIAAEPVPISEKIQPIIEQIYWPAAAAWACSAVLGDYAYFAVPRNGPRNNGILVLNTTNYEWESAPDWWDDPTFFIDRLLVTNYNNEQRLFALDYYNSRIYLLYDGLTDEINNDSLQIRDAFETRGYVFGDRAAFKDFTDVKIGVRTLDPDLVVSSITDGVNEEKELGTITKERAEFYTHGKSPFDPDVDAADAPFRTDYSVGTIENFIGMDFNDLPLGPLYSIPAYPPLLVDYPKQSTVEPFMIGQNGRWVSIRGEGNGGITNVIGIQVEAISSSKEGIKTLA